MRGLDSIDPKVKSKIHTQDYSPKKQIEGVRIVEVKNFEGEEGDLSEVIKVNDKGELEGFPGFKLAQVNRTKNFPGTVKAWHIHLEQDEIWYLPPSYHLIVGLWDIRKNSKTKDVVQRVVLGGGKSKLLFIPKGVAHGSVNVLNTAIELFYFTNKRFNISNPDEKRLPWDSKGADFWDVLKD